MIKKLAKEEITYLYQFMEVDFPADELKPLREILRYLDEGKAMFLGYYHQKKLIGYASVIIGYDHHLLLDYLAILDPYKHQGQGTVFMNELKDYLKDGNLLWIEAEAWQNPQAISRMKFYERCGAVNTDVNITLYFVDYHLLVVPLKGNAEKNCYQMVEKLYQSVYPKQFLQQYWKIKKEA